VRSKALPEAQKAEWFERRIGVAMRAREGELMDRMVRAGEGLGPRASTAGTWRTVYAFTIIAFQSNEDGCGLLKRVDAGLPSAGKEKSQRLRMNGAQGNRAKVRRRSRNPHASRAEACGTLSGYAGT